MVHRHQVHRRRELHREAVNIRQTAQVYTKHITINTSINNNDPTHNNNSSFDEQHIQIGNFDNLCFDIFACDI